MSYAIIETGSKQYKVNKGDIIDVELLDAASAAAFDKVLLIADDSNVKIGNPYVAGASVSAKVLETVKDKKVTSFKYKNKTNYHRTIGHRQKYIRVQIEEIKNGA